MDMVRAFTPYSWCYFRSFKKITDSKWVLKKMRLRDIMEYSILNIPFRILSYILDHKYNQDDVDSLPLIMRLLLFIFMLAVFCGLAINIIAFPSVPI